VLPGRALLGTSAGTFVVSDASDSTPGTSLVSSEPDFVITPGGQRKRSLVYHIPDGTVLDGADLKLRNVLTSGDLVADFGALKSRDGGQPLMPLNVTLPTLDVVQRLAPTEAPVTLKPPLTNGWITYSGWYNNTGVPISSFSTTWKVPPAPISKGSQIVYLFNGIQNSTMIYQPVLQWGNDGFGGGQYWVVASWYADGQGGPAFHSTFVRVNPGDILTGVMTLTGRNGNMFNYNCEFAGIPGASLPITNVEELKWCVETLECYNMVSAMSYPPTFRTSMKNIKIATATTNPNVTWQISNSVTDCGQHTDVVSNSSVNGEVDLCYGVSGPASISSVSWSIDRLDIFGLGTDDAMYHKAWNGSSWTPSSAGWDYLGGRFNSPPSAVSWGPGRLDIFGLGTNNNMYHKSWENGWGPSATSWEWLGGIFNSPPAVCSWGRNRIDVFGLGTDDQMYHKAWNGRWNPSVTAWEALGGVFNSPPAAVSWGADRLDIFGLGTDNQMYHKSWDGVQWGPSATGWEALGGVFNSAPAVVSWGPNRLDIFGLGTDNQMYHKSWDGSQWGPSLTGVRKFSPQTPFSSSLLRHFFLDFYGGEHTQIAHILCTLTTNEKLTMQCSSGKLWAESSIACQP
jgi:hypothetical protein